MTLNIQAGLLNTLMTSRSQTALNILADWQLYQSLFTQGILQNLPQTRIALDYSARIDADILDNLTTAILALDGI